MQAPLRGRLQHADLRHYNMVQRVAYLSVMILGVMSALSGLVLWKSVQFPPLRTLLGGYEAARYIHFCHVGAGGLRRDSPGDGGAGAADAAGHAARTLRSE